MILSAQFSFLQCDIRTEEERAGILNIADPLYPALAAPCRRALNNLKATVEALQKGLAETLGIELLDRGK
jgi:hypothetical protein